MKKIITIKKNYEVKYLLSKGVWVKGKYIAIYFKKRENSTNNKVCFIVSKKSGNSVFRNRIRRLMRQAYFDNFNNIKNGYNMLVMWKKNENIKDIKCQQVYDDMHMLLVKKDLLK